MAVRQAGRDVGSPSLAYTSTGAFAGRLVIVSNEATHRAAELTQQPWKALELESASRPRPEAEQDSVRQDAPAWRRSRSVYGSLYRAGLVTCSERSVA